MRENPKKARQAKPKLSVKKTKAKKAAQKTSVLSKEIKKGARRGAQSGWPQKESIKE